MPTERSRVVFPDVLEPLTISTRGAVHPRGDECSGALPRAPRLLA